MTIVISVLRVPSLADPAPMSLSRPLAISLLAAAPAIAWAFESDTLTPRLSALEDATEIADTKADELLAQAVAAANRRVGCGGEPARRPLSDRDARELIAHEVREAMGAPVWVPARGRQPAMRYGVYSAWLETGPVPRHEFVDRDDIYSNVTWWDNPIVHSYGPASTVRLGDVLVGADKIDHFWVQGFLYFRRSLTGRGEGDVVEWGTQTERAYWGLGTTGIFSFADLAANYAGYRFYAGLLDEGSVVVRGDDGCFAQARPFAWSEWVTEDFDEVLNPSSYRPSRLRALRQYLLENRDSICPAYRAWGTRPPEVPLPPEYVGSKAPFRSDPYDFEMLCGDTLDGAAVEGP